MDEHRPVTAIIKGTGFNSNGGGFSRIDINGKRYHPDDVANAIASAPTLAAENERLKADFAEMHERLLTAYSAKARWNDEANHERRRANDAVAELATLKALVAEMVEGLEKIRFYSSAYSEIRRIAVALIARAKGAAAS